MMKANCQVPPAKAGWLVPERDEWRIALFETIGFLTKAHILYLEIFFAAR